MKFYDEYTKDSNYDYIDKLEIENDNYLVNNIIVENNRCIIGDIVKIKNNKIIDCVERSQNKIVGILKINNIKKYGKNKNNKEIYEFLPINKRYPTYMVASSHKGIKNIYVTIIFHCWETDNKRPIGKIDNVIGEVGVFDNEIKLLLNKYDLNKNKNIFNINKEKICEDLNKNQLLQKEISNINIYTIDPVGCQDIDDGISFYENNDYYYIEIHITDIMYYFNEININKDYNLYSTLYLHNKIDNMLPNEYSNNILSLKENNKRSVITLTLKYDKNYNYITYNINKNIVFIEKNYNYDEFDKLLKKGKFQLENKFMIKNNFKTSHELIEHLMIKSNCIIGDYLFKKYNNKTILRLHEKNENLINENLKNIKNKDLYEYLKIKSTNKAIYVNNFNDNIYHYGLDCYNYTHFTSPIRRYVDIIIHKQINSYVEFDNNELIQNINIKNNKIKKFYRDLNKIILIKKFEDIYKNDKIQCKGYITSIKLNYIKIYLNEYNFEEKIYYNEFNNEKYLNLKLYDELDIYIIPFLNSLNFQDKIKIILK